MALDNESESVLDYFEDNSSEEQLQKIIEQGVSHLYSNARWQISELLYRRKPENYQNIYLSFQWIGTHMYEIGLKIVLN